MRITKKFDLDNPVDFKTKALYWADQFRNFHYLNGNDLPYLYDSFPCLLAVSNQKAVIIQKGDPNTSIHSILQRKDWWFGYLGYGFSNEHYDYEALGFKTGEWFCPETILTFDLHNGVLIESDREPIEILEEINQLSFPVPQTTIVQVTARLKKEEYLERIEQLKKHLLRGNIYQVNFCTSFFSDDATIHPVEVYGNLNRVSPMPFSSLLKLNNKYIISASPERYLKRISTKLISQPMKGTAPIGRDEEEKRINLQKLVQSAKERAENIMIVDLVRNDLSQVCVPGSVKVEELCGVRSFYPVHQMVSTVVGGISPGISTEEVIDATFPMGSMTGAPKIRAMELIHEFEPIGRGPFSGALGYFDPEGNFDFNVLIRSIFYNSETKQLSYNVGSGVTTLSNAEDEYEECLLKAKMIGQVLGN